VTGNVERPRVDPATIVPLSRELRVPRLVILLTAIERVGAR
jgi:hypothetical protein